MINLNARNKQRLCPSGRNEGPIVVILDECMKLYLADDNEECKK